MGGELVELAGYRLELVDERLGVARAALGDRPGEVGDMALEGPEAGLAGTGPAQGVDPFGEVVEAALEPVMGVGRKPGEALRDIRDVVAQILDGGIGRWGRSALAPGEAQRRDLVGEPRDLVLDPDEGDAGRAQRGLAGGVARPGRPNGLVAQVGVVAALLEARLTGADLGDGMVEARTRPPRLRGPGLPGAAAAAGGHRVHHLGELGLDAGGALRVTAGLLPLAMGGVKLAGDLGEATVELGGGAGEVVRCRAGALRLLEQRGQATLQLLDRRPEGFCPLVRQAALDLVEARGDGLDGVDRLAIGRPRLLGRGARRALGGLDPFGDGREGARGPRLGVAIGLGEALNEVRGPGLGLGIAVDEGLEDGGGPLLGFAQPLLGGPRLLPVGGRVRERRRLGGRRRGLGGAAVHGLELVGEGIERRGAGVIPPDVVHFTGVARLARPAACVPPIREGAPGCGIPARTVVVALFLLPRVRRRLLRGLVRDHRVEPLAERHPGPTRELLSGLAGIRAHTLHAPGNALFHA